MQFCEYFRQRLDYLKISQARVATELGVSRQAVNKWSSGSSLPDIQLFPALAEILRTDPYNLVGFIWGRTDLSTPNRKTEYVFSSTSNAACFFEPDAVTQLELKKFRVVCTANEFNVFMRKKADRLGVRVISPEYEKRRIIRNKLPGWTHYNQRDLITVFLSDCEDGYITGKINSAAMLSNAKSIIFSKFRAVLSPERISELCREDPERYNICHKQLCEELIGIEDEVLRNPLFSDCVCENAGFRYFNAQYVINSIANKLADYGKLRDGCDVSMLHSVIGFEEAKKFGYSLDTYEWYLSAQDIILDRAREAGFASRYAFDTSNPAVKKNLLNYFRESEYRDYLGTLNGRELAEELCLSQKIRSETEKALASAVVSIRDFLRYDFLRSGREDRKAEDSFGRYDLENSFELRVREKELVMMDEKGTAEIVESKLKQLYLVYKRLMKSIAGLKACSGDGEPEETDAPDGAISEILDVRRSLLGESGGLDGSFNRLTTVVNDLGVHVCSWYYHLFDKKILDQRQTVGSSAASRMLVRRNEDGDVSFSETVKLMKDEFEEMLTKIGESV